MSEIKKVKRIIYYYELHLEYLDTLKAIDNDYCREFFSKIYQVIINKEKIRYIPYSDKKLFITDIIFDSSTKSIQGKFRSIRTDIFPELIDMVTDEINEFETTGKNAGIIETSHFIIKYGKKVPILALEFNQDGPKFGDLIHYLNEIGKAKQYLASVAVIPIFKDNLSKLKSRINRCSQILIKLHKDNIQEAIDLDDNPIFKGMQETTDYINSQYAEIILKIDYKRLESTEVANGFISRIINKFVSNKQNTTIFNTFKVKAEDSESNNIIKYFDLLADKTKSQISVEKNETHRILISADMFDKMKTELSKLRL